MTWVGREFLRRAIRNPIGSLLRATTTLLERDKEDLLVLRDDRKKAAVVLVHGFAGELSETWGQFPSFLMAEPGLRSWDFYAYGYPSSLRIDIPGIWSASPNIPSIADALRSRLQHDPLKDYHTLALLAHSMGGLALQEMLVKYPDVAARISHVFMFGVPSAGVAKASIGRHISRQLSDMLEGGEFVTSLRREWTNRFDDKPPFFFRSIAGRVDSFVPATSSLDPFAREYQELVPGDHLQIVKPVSGADVSVRVVAEGLQGRAAPRGPWDSALVAAELREFHKVVAQLEPNIPNLDEDAANALALAYDGLGRNGDALRLLQARIDAGLTTSEPWSVLGGRYKRRWLLERSEMDLASALYSYGEGLRLSVDEAGNATNPGQAMYAAINLAFLELMRVPSNQIRMPAVARDFAQRASLYANSAESGLWRLATEGEAWLYRENIEAASAAYATAIELAKPREIDTMYTQALRVCERIGDKGFLTEIQRVFGHTPVSG
jgi:pimeloyl-ACP methyl ester carboxylesterase